MHVTAKVDYAVRALAVIAIAEGTSDGNSVKAETIAEVQQIPLGFLRGILTDLRRSGLISSQQGASGGFRLAHPASEISIGDVFRAIEGPLAEVRGERPNELEYPESVQALQSVWVAVRASLRAVLDHTTIADIANNSLPEHVALLTADPSAWEIVQRR